jgi:hypothetical protein
MLAGNDIAVLLAFFAAAITLAGSSGIITAIDRSAAPASSEVITFRLTNLTRSAFHLAALAILPIVLDALEIVRHTLWQFSVMCAAIVLAGSLATALSAMARLNQQTGRGLSLLLAIFLSTTGFAVLILDLFGAGGLVASRGVYFLTLSQFLTIILAMFYRIILVAIGATGNNAAPRQRQ